LLISFKSIRVLVGFALALPPQDFHPEDIVIGPDLFDFIDE